MLELVGLVSLGDKNVTLLSGGEANIHGNSRTFGGAGARHHSIPEIRRDARDDGAAICRFPGQSQHGLRVIESFTDQVARSERRLVVAITSGMGSLRDNTTGGSTRNSSTGRPVTGRSSQLYRFGAGKRCVTSTCNGEALFVIRRGGVFNRVCQRRSKSRAP